jgi:hypothetical protein
MPIPGLPREIGRDTTLNSAKLVFRERKLTPTLQDFFGKIARHRGIAAIQKPRDAQFAHTPDHPIRILLPLPDLKA